jgi:hypothetical protein
VVEERFGGSTARSSTARPPHGGMAAGVDRIVMLLVGAKNLREVTLFPMNQQAQDLLMGAPGSGTLYFCAFWRAACTYTSIVSVSRESASNSTAVLRQKTIAPLRSTIRSGTTCSGRLSAV